MKKNLRQGRSEEGLKLIGWNKCGINVHFQKISDFGKRMLLII